MKPVAIPNDYLVPICKPNFPTASAWPMTRRQSIQPRFSLCANSRIQGLLPCGLYERFLTVMLTLVLRTSLLAALFARFSQYHCSSFENPRLNDKALEFSLACHTETRHFCSIYPNLVYRNNYSESQRSLSTWFCLLVLTRGIICIRSHGSIIPSRRAPM